MSPRHVTRLAVVKVLVLGSGAREHALVRALASDSSVTALYAAPGNAGIAGEAELHACDLTDPSAPAALAVELGVDLVVVGPEGPLVIGAADHIRAAGIATFGPDAAAAALEGSKAFAKEIMAAAGVPTAMAHICDTLDEVAVAFDQFGAPYVVKDDGLAAGKGVVVTDDRVDALEHARLCLDKPHGRVVVEEYLDGPEVSLFCLSDGEHVVPLQPAQDFKRVGDGDAGPNTGGMGAYAPANFLSTEQLDEVGRTVIAPTLAELRRRGISFRGTLYAGLMLTPAGHRVLEFNARLGDPETQVLMMQLDTDLVPVLQACARGALTNTMLPQRAGFSVGIVLAAEGYPEAPRTGDAIALPTSQPAGTQLFHAGTKLNGDQLVSAGGRVITACAYGATLLEARARATALAETITWRGRHFRKDIAAGAPP